MSARFRCTTVPGSWALLLLATLSGVRATQPNLPAVIRVDTTVVATDIEPIGANLTRIAGGANLATNNHVFNSGFEPITWRLIAPVSEAGDNWFEYTVDGGIDYWNLMWTGYGNGAEVRFYRVTDANGDPMPYNENGDWLDVSTADHIELLGVDTVPMPSAAFPEGGWISNHYVRFQGDIRDNASVTDPRNMANGDTLYYVITAVDAEGNESAFSNEVMVVPNASSTAGPYIYTDMNSSPPEAVGGDVYKDGWRTGWTLRVAGGTSPYTWSIVGGSLPDGLSLDTSSGKISGTPTSTPDATRFTVQVQDDAGGTATRVYTINPADPANAAGDPAAPTNLNATAGNGFVTLSWDASTSSDVAKYYMYRSDTPLAQQENRIYLKNGGFGLRKFDHALIYLKRNFIPRETSSPHMRNFWSGDNGGIGLEGSGVTAMRVPHPGTLPDEMEYPGETCLEVTATGEGNKRIREIHFHRPDHASATWYTQLTPGAPYRVEVWLRQEGLANDGAVRFRFTQSETYAVANQTTPWSVTSEWRKYTYDFEGPPYSTDNHRWHIGMCLEFTGPGTLWVDNWVVYKNDEKHEFRPYTPCNISFDELMSCMPPVGKKPAIRMYPVGIYNNSSIEANLSYHANAGYKRSWNSGISGSRPVTIPQTMYWCYKTGNSPETRAVPYLTCTEEYTEHDWKALVEYLGVPYDPATDSPESKPFAYKRYLQRDRDGTPWTDEFREILIEYGNETWHNGAGGYGWHGFGKPMGVHFGGKEYGLFAKYMFNGAAMSMPAWTANNLGDKIKFTLGGNYSTLPSGMAYGEIAIQQGADISYLGHANYVGPKWETGDPAATSYTVDGMQKVLLSVVVNRIGRVIEGAKASRDSLRTHGIDYRVIAYEGGPSGYKPGETNETAELYGKSLGMGVAALDAWLMSSQNGYGHQCYLGFSSGNGWSSHTMPEAGGFRAHPGWLALKLRNRFAIGDEMVRTTVESSPTLTYDTTEHPLIKAYTIRGDAGHFVFVLSRKIQGSHNGADFGDGYTPTTLQLPFDTPQRITLYKLVGTDGNPISPMAHNRDRLRVVIDSTNIDVSNFSTSFAINESTGGGSGGMPPGTVFLYAFVMDTTTLSVARHEPGMSSITEPTGGEMTALGWGTQPGSDSQTGTADAPQGTIVSPYSPAASEEPPHMRSDPMLLADPWGNDRAAERAKRAMATQDSAHQHPSSTANSDVAESEYAHAISAADNQAGKVDSTRFIWNAPETAIEAVSVTASGEEESNGVVHVLDRDLRTRWSSGTTGESCLTLDLGETRQTAGAALLWYAPNHIEATLVVSASTGDGEYRTVAQQLLEGRGSIETRCAFEPATARYIRFELKNSSHESLSVYEAAALRPAVEREEASVR